MDHPQTSSEGAYFEYVIASDVGPGAFYAAQEELAGLPNATLGAVIDGLDTAYLDFTFDGAELTLHYNIYMGLSVYARRMEAGSEHDHSKAAAVGALLRERLG